MNFAEALQSAPKPLASRAALNASRGSTGVLDARNTLAWRPPEQVFSLRFLAECAQGATFDGVCVSTIEATDPGQAFRDSFPAHLQGLFLTCLQRAVDTGREAHLSAQGRGANETTFGVGVYNFAVHELREAVRQQPELGIKVRMEQQAFRLRVGPYKVACYKVGEFAYENIWASFPNPGASHEMVVGQDRPQWLPGMAPNLEGLRTVVIAYMCNPETGLEAVYLCIPTKGSHQKITEWGYALPVWVRSSDTASASIGDSTPESLPPEEHVESPVVVLKPRKETGS